MTTIPVATRTPYDVLIGANLLPSVGTYTAQVKQPCRVLVISDDRVFPLYGETVKTSFENVGFTVSTYVFPHGEASKNLTTFGNILECAAGERLTRTDLIAALGGGVVGDVAGFAAACYLRGIDFVQIPTSLLAAVDSSVGGKTAVDLDAGKNLAGAFHEPIRVLCDTNVFATLDARERACGMGEVIKYGLMNDRAFFETLETGVPDAEELVRRCVNNKRQIVEHDEFEHGERKLLNLGHTFGHAVEKHSGFALSHGAAVAIGMHMICRVSEEIGLAEEPLCARLDALLEKYGLPTAYAIAPEELAAFARGDKKTAGDTITPVFPVCIGACVLKKLPLAEFEALAVAACRPTK